MLKLVNRNTKKYYKFTAYILVVALLFSFSAEALHLSSHNDHVHCTEHATTHFHQDEIKCDIFDFKFSAAATFLALEIKPTVLNNFSLEESNYQFFFYQLSANNNFNRGPPFA